MAIKIEIFNDLNKLVKTVQMVDKLLTEKPKTHYFTKRFTEKELDYMYLTLKKIERDYILDEKSKLIHKKLEKKFLL
jgi:hypothetical protein